MHAQHDPEDEPVVASLAPDYFEFDSEHDLSPGFITASSCPIAVHKEDLSKEQLKGTQVGGSVDDPVS